MSTSSDSAATTTASHERAVVLPAPLHARPAGRLARAAAGFTSAVRLEHGGRTVDPTGVLAVMGLGATAGSTVTVRAEGPDAEQAVAALADILATAE
ncbi:HPr family phosphocarrier protein [Streptomyces sp. NPDC005648]|uniref:HPr family phosphocarrier protein n=1 Tax=Streptomyces sp. NPDC005648 TaxID=3157044 RepID=UPI00339EC6FE